MTHRRSRRGAALTLALALALSACGGGGNDDEPTAGNGDGGTPTTEDREVDPDGEVRVMTVVVPSSLDPHRSVNPAAIYYWNLMYDRLTRLDDNLQPEPMLATEWEFSDENKVVTIKLRDDVTFHDGTAFDASVVVANLDRAQNLEGSTVANDLAGLVSVEAVSDTEVRLTFDQPRPDIMVTFSGPVGAMLSPAIFDDPSIDLQTQAADAGSGPYLLEEFVPSESATFVRAEGENWDADAGQAARITIQWVADDRTRFSALRAGEADVIYVQAGNPNDISEARSLGEGGQPYRYITTKTSVMAGLMLRSQKAPMDDLRVRQALNHAIDADAIVNDYLRGFCTRTEQLVPEGMPGHLEDFEDPYPYDVDAAKALLEEAGLGGGFPLDVYVIQGRPEIPQIIQEQLAELDIDVTVTPLNSVEILTAWTRNETPTWMWQASALGHPHSTFRSFVTSPTGAATQDQEILDAFGAAAPLTGDEAEAAYEEAFRLLTEKALWVPMCWYDSHHVVAEDVVNFEEALIPSGQFAFDLRYVGKAAS